MADVRQAVTVFAEHRSARRMLILVSTALVSAALLCALVATQVATVQARSRSRRPVGPPLVHCTRAGETPKQIARYYGIRLKDLARHSGAVQRLQADNRRLKHRNAKRKLRAQLRHRKALKKWKKKWKKKPRRKPHRKRSRRPKLVYTPLKPRVFGLHEAVRIMRPMKKHAVRDAVLRLHRGARVAWVAKTFGVPASLVRCVNTLKKRQIGVGCRRKRITGKRRRGLPRYTYSCDGGRKWLTVRLPLPKKKSRSTGSTNGGHLRRGEAMPRVPGMVLKQKKNGYGTQELISRLIDAVGQVNKRYAETPDLVIGDLSRQGGGRLKPHKSHQNGLDADIGYYHLSAVPKTRFTVATAKNLDRGRTWTLIKKLLESGEVQYIFMSTSIQKLLRAYVLKRRRADSSWCLRFLRVLAHRRYGKVRKRRRGRHAAGWERCVLKTFSLRGDHNALIRHAKGHDNHLHLRLFPRGGRSRGGGAP